MNETEHSMNANHSVEVIAPTAAKRRATGRPALVEHLRRLRENAALFLSLAEEAGIDIDDSACPPVIPCLVGSSIKALQLSDALMRRGINVIPILFPAVPEDKARLRFFVTSCHSSEQIRFMVTVLAEELGLLNACGPQDFHKHSPRRLPDGDFGKPRSERRH
jgi:7-keto-8-aminopelargonate synthetase-like enzyme